MKNATGRPWRGVSWLVGWDDGVGGLSCYALNPKTVRSYSTQATSYIFRNDGGRYRSGTADGGRT